MKREKIFIVVLVVKWKECSLFIKLVPRSNPQIIKIYFLRFSLVLYTLFFISVFHMLKILSLKLKITVGKRFSKNQSGIFLSLHFLYLCLRIFHQK